MITGSQFCYWDAKSPIDTYFLMVNLAIVTTVCLWCIWYFRKKFLYLLFAHFRGIFMGVFFWALASIISISYGIIAYYTRFSGQRDQKGAMTLFSQIYMITETAPALILQTILIFIPINIMRNMLNLLSENNQMQQKDIRKYEAFNLYQKLRLVFFSLIWLSMFFPYDSIYVLNNISIIKSIMISADSLVCTAALVWAVKSNQVFSEILMKENADDRRTLHHELLMIMFTCISRSLINMACYVILPSINPHGSISCIEEIQSHLPFSIINLVIGPLLTHLLPIVSILKMYRVQKIQRRLRQQIKADNNNILQDSSRLESEIL